jgi:peptidoglycan/LPS O-acetylase OafA/YrhL
MNSFLMGFMAALTVQKMKESSRLLEHKRLISNTLQILGILFTFFLMFMGRERATGKFHFGLFFFIIFGDYGWCPLVSFSLALLLVGAAFAEGWMNRIWRARSLSFIGVISYGIFLWHGTIGHVLIKFDFFDFSKPYLRVTVIFLSVLCLSIIFGSLSFVFVEAPYLKRKKINRELLPGQPYPVQGFPYVPAPAPVIKS